MLHASELKLDKLSSSLAERIEKDRRENIVFPYAFNDDECCRRDPNRDRASIVRPAFVRDCEKILHSSYYNRYADKTQVFSFYRNDDITRRAQHVQLVSRIARNIGRVLRLNVDLIEAIALGHDIGHTPFGHAGESFLNEIYHSYTGRYFQHNVHSVRVLDGIVPLNLTLQTLDGILSHNGEMELEEYRPGNIHSFAEFDREIENCYTDISHNLTMIPSTLEGCVVRICDIIAYLGKDRQDALRAKRIDKMDIFPAGPIGTTNAEIINNLSVNIIENSYGQPFIKMDKEYYDALKFAKQQNYELIYLNDNGEYRDKIFPMMKQIYDKLRDDLLNERRSSPIFEHHIEFVERNLYRSSPYRTEQADQIVVDYIAGMTDDYFLDLYEYLFPKSNAGIEFKGYF